MKAPSWYGWLAFWKKPKSVAPPPAPQSCATCRFWYPWAWSGAPASSGTCVRRAPVALSRYNHVQPETRDTFWCGDWEEKKEHPHG